MLFLLENKLQNEHKSIEEVTAANLFKQAYENQLQILYFMVYKQFYFKCESESRFTIPVLRFICQAYRRFPQNVIFLSEAMNMLNKFSHRTNRLLKLKTELGIRVYRPIVWIFIIFEELCTFAGDESGSLVNLISSYFKEFVKIDNPYDYYLDKLEQRYKQPDSSVDWQEKRVLHEDFLAQMATLSRFFALFMKKFLSSRLKRKHFDNVTQGTLRQGMLSKVDEVIILS